MRGAERAGRLFGSGKVSDRRPRRRGIRPWSNGAIRLPPPTAIAARPIQIMSDESTRASRSPGSVTSPANSRRTTSAPPIRRTGPATRLPIPDGNGPLVLTQGHNHRFSRFRGTVQQGPVHRQETQIVQSWLTLRDFLPGFRPLAIRPRGESVAHDPCALRQRYLGGRSSSSASPGIREVWPRGIRARRGRSSRHRADGPREVSGTAET